MTRIQRPAALLLLPFALLIGCGSGSPVASRATASPMAQEPPRVAQSPTPQLAGLPSGTTSTGLLPAPSPRVASAPRSQALPALGLELLVGGLDQPVHVTHAGDGSGRLFIVEKKGRIVIVRNGAVDPTPFLDIGPLVGSGGSEQGLLSVAFHPDYVANGSLYVNYTDRDGHTMIVRYQAQAGNPDQADSNSALTLLKIEQPAANHNGGLTTFGPDGYLYIGMGDGGRAGDPRGNAQNRAVLLGKMLRIDVNGGSPYGIPADNPFVNDPTARPEVWAYGLRNPWRFSFDRASGDLFIADVGQNKWEWAHLQRAAAGGGQNYGWNQVEGSHCFPPDSACDPAVFPQPVAEYDHSQGCSITGGHVYRGASFPQLGGVYFFGDYCSGRVWALQEQAPDSWSQQEIMKTPHRISSFGEDEAGEIYLVSFSEGGLYRLVVAP